MKSAAAVQQSACAPAHLKSRLPAPQAAPVFRTPLGAAVHAFFFDPAARRGPGVPVHELFLPR